MWSHVITAFQEGDWKHYQTDPNPYLLHIETRLRTLLQMPYLYLWMLRRMTAASRLKKDELGGPD